MDASRVDNDTRGWIMTALSGIACMLGASIICLDLLINQIPRDSCRNFKIQDSNAFLSSSLSLSFGVMLFSSLYTMLPNAKQSLVKGDFSPKAASWILIALFLAGVLGIQVLSKVLHHFIPSHVVDCDHSHDHEDEPTPRPEVQERTSLPRWRSGHSIHRSYGSSNAIASLPTHGRLDEESGNGHLAPHRPSLTARVSEIVRAKKLMCNEDGECHGLSNPCGADCFKIVQARGGFRNPRLHTSLSRSNTMPTQGAHERQPLLRAVEEEAVHADSGLDVQAADGYFPAQKGHSNSESSVKQLSRTSSGTSMHSHHHLDHHENPPPEHHHHHVPTNAFLSIGLQTCIAIALHKLPEGFITYATNHANPKLGFSVFVALFVHNITEGFAMALPLYLAIQSRPKAMFWAAILGGVSQPLGAGVAALWFKIAGTKLGNEPGEGVYGCMFAIVAGIMSSVALQLFSESLDLTHNRNLCMVFAFVGMGILGCSSALTA